MNPPADTPLLALRGATVGAARDPERAVLRGVDWTVRAGEFWVIAGLHGSGKTDLLHCVAGLTPPLAGEYELFGRAMPGFTDADLPLRLRLGLVFDGGNLLHHLTVAENIALPVRYHRNLSAGEATVRIAPLLEQLGLAALAERRPETVPRTWLRRAGLARALVLPPELLLLDNPLTGMDARQTAWWLATLADLARGTLLAGVGPMTLVATTASFRPWRRLATRFACVRDGRFAVLGEAAALDATPDPELRELLGDHALFDSD